MPKVMLVEDDNALREIYDARLAAEGYEIVSAHDGEEALALAVKEKPDLIISDVMMPKISGFDMLDILRSTPETKNTKVIMMTALSQAEDRQRADKLGADRYLVKSQVTLEDVIKVAHEILNDAGPAPAPATPAVTPTVTNDAPVAAPAATPVASEPVAAPAPVADVPVAEPPTATPPATAPAEPPTPVTPPAEPTTTVTTVEPLDDTAKKEEPAPATTQENTPTAPPPPAAPLEEPTASAPPVPEVAATPVPIADNLTQTKSEETDGVEKQIQDFVANNPTLTTAADASAPATPATAPTPQSETPAASTPTSIPVTTPDEPPATPAVPAPDPQDELSNPTGHTSSTSNPEPPSHKKLVLTPTDTALAPAVDLDALLAKENANDAIATPGTNTIITPNTDDQPTNDTPANTVSPNDISL